MRILEVGCGRGIAIPVLAHHCRPERLVGIDIDGSLIDEAKQRAQALGVEAELYQGDVRALDFKDRSFDMVIDFGTCYHIGQPEQALGEIARVLMPSGLFVHETPLSQLLAHPGRSSRFTLPWDAAPNLKLHRTALLWSSRQKRFLATARGGGFPKWMKYDPY